MSHAPINRTEEFVHRICENSFLSLWCYANPRAKPGKELCDILVVCEPAVIIVSVKEIKLNEQKEPAVAHARWEKKAITDSVKQIYGAEGWLATASNVIRNDGSPGLKLPPPEIRRTFRIAVAFGAGGQAIVKSGDFGEGFVHVMTEQSFHEVLTELDTITDLTEYLTAKETLVQGKSLVVCEGSESNMLGWYLTHEHSFPQGKDVIMFDDTIWAGLQTDVAFLRRKVADEGSYAWDRLIEGLSDPRAKPVEGAGPELNELELALRQMARESRLNRRALGAEARDFVVAAQAGKLRSRLLCSKSGLIFVMVYFPPTETPEMRRNEIIGRCYVGRQRMGQGDVLVGIGLSRHVPGLGSASDLIYLKFPRWSDEDDVFAREIQERLGYFANVPTRHRHEDEFPTETTPQPP